MIGASPYVDEPEDIEYGEHIDAIDDAEDVADEPWDEGGRSDCGYSDGVHDTLMSIGEFVHSIFGEPSNDLKAHMRGIGSYFQEASYAARDLGRNRDNLSGAEETAAAMKSYLFFEDIEEVEEDYEDEDVEP